MARGDEAIPDLPERLNLAGYFLDPNLEAGRGGKTALLDDAGEQTYGEVHAASCRVANLLRRLGIEQEDRVLLALPDAREFVAAWFGAARAGAVICMVNVILTEDDYAYYLEYTRARAVFIDPALVPIFERLRPRARWLKHVIVAGGDGEARAFIPMAAACAAERAEAGTAPTHRDDPAIWLFTSGSTGRAKACMHLMHDLPWNTERYAKRVLRMSAEDRTAGVPKLFFGYATGTNLLFPFAVGGSAALFKDRSTAAKLFEVIEKYRPTVLTSVPTMIAAMLDHERATGADLSCLRACLSAGEALPAELYKRWKARTGVEILDGIGSAEMFHIYITNKPGDVTPGSLGTLVPGYEARIVDEADREVATGDVGTLWVRGDSAMVGYWLDHERSKHAVRGDWCVSADQFRRDADGRFWYAGRADDLLKVGGVFVSPLEVENCLLEHEAVTECCVVGWKDADGLVKSLAWVAVRPPAEVGAALAVALAQHVKGRLAPYKYPRRVEFLPELPKNERGKVDRRALRERAETLKP